jgi:hypothetical protein
MALARRWRGIVKRTDPRVMDTGLVEAGPETGLTAGVARAVITPPVGIALTGFAGRAPSEGIHDDLQATALVLAERGPDGDVRDGRVALVTLDLLDLYDDAIIAAIKAQVGRATGIPAGRVFLACSHTHYGPVVSPDRDMEGGATAQALAYQAALPHHVAGAVAMADAARRPVTLAAGRGSVRIGINRRERRPDGRIVLGQNPTGPQDAEVQVWRLDAADGDPVTPGAPPGWLRRAPQPVAVLVNAACHPVSLGGQMRQISADFPGIARGVVEHLVGGTALYVQGACGNINPSLMGADWGNPLRLGRALGAEATRVALLAQPVAATPLRVARETVAFPGLLPSSLGAAREQVVTLEAEQARLATQPGNAGAKWWNQRALAQARLALAALGGGAPLVVEGDLAVLRLGDAALACNPSELFCEIGQAIKAASPFPWTAIAGYTDGGIWYVPTRQAYPEGGYEVERACRVAPEASELLQETTLRLLQAVR